MRFKIKTWVSISLLLLVAHQWGHAAMIYGKAKLAQALISNAWEFRLSNPHLTASEAKPWSWADTWPVARLRLHRAEKTLEFYVLAGASGSSLAFGPGHMMGSALPGQGASIIAGHRDTHFTALEDVKHGDVIDIQIPNGVWLSYTVKQIQIVDSDQQTLALDPEQNILTLVTCYPFDAIKPGGSLRYVISAPLRRQPSFSSLQSMTSISF